VTLQCFWGESFNSRSAYFHSASAHTQYTLTTRLSFYIIGFRVRVGLTPLNPTGSSQTMSSTRSIRRVNNPNLRGLSEQSFLITNMFSYLLTTLLTTLLVILPTRRPTCSATNSATYSLQNMLQNMLHTTWFNTRHSLNDLLHSLLHSMLHTCFIAHAN